MEERQQRGMHPESVVVSGWRAPACLREGDLEG